MQYSFYGGQQGKSFKISAIFSNKLELAADLSMRWSSPVGVGEYVLITYGLPGPQYAENAGKDVDRYGKAYNTTLWEKIYIEQGAAGEVYSVPGLNGNLVSMWQNFELVFPDRADYGVAYKLIAAMTGNTPEIQLDTTEVLNVDQDPDVTLDLTNPDFPILKFHLPQSQKILPQHVKVTLKDVGTDPSVVFNIVGRNADNTLRINQPELEFIIPKSQKINFTGWTLTNVKNVTDNPEVIWDETDINNPKLTFNLPQAQKVLPENVHYSVLKANQDPTFEFKTDGTNPNGSLRINFPEVNIGLPTAENIGIDPVDILNAETDPYVTIDKTTDPDNPVLTFHLPQMWKITAENLPKGHADEDPVVTLDKSDINNLVLKFKLPRAQLIGVGPTTVLPPQDDPSVAIDNSNIDNPKLKFSLPRAARFTFGEGVLGEKSAGTYIKTFAELGNSDFRPGDYYIDKPTGFLYIVRSVTDTSARFEYLGALLAPLPTIGVTEVDPYNADGSAKTPITASSSYDNPTEGTGWKINFSLPKVPDLEAEGHEVAPYEDAAAAVKPINKDTVKFDFNIPRGSWMFAGDAVNESNVGTAVTVIETITEGTETKTYTAQNGDMYLNGDTGNIYIMRGGIWMKQKGNLQGPVGEALHVVKSYTFKSDEFATASPTTPLVDTLASIAPEVELKYKADFSGNMPLDEDLISVTWVDKDVNPAKETSYWYYYNDRDGWQRVQLTAGVSSFIVSEYIDTTSPGAERVQNKAYSVDYVNRLIGGNFIEPNEETRKTYSADELLHMLSWRDMTDIGTPADAVPPGNHDYKDALSAAEILDLLSWGDMAKDSLTTS